MAVREIFETIAAMFERENAEYAVIGAYALYAFGYVRATKDIDFVTRIQTQPRITGHLESLGFKTIHSSEVFSNHLHPIGNTRVDFMYVDNHTADILFKKAQKKILFKDCAIPVVSPEDLVAMKLFSASHNEERRFKDLADVKELSKVAKIDPHTLKKLFVKYNMEKYFPGTDD
jgi:predicted nucleotidyltransferase